MSTAADVMTRGVITLPVEATVAQAIDLLLRNRISGAPVVDRDGKICGLISEYQLLETIYSPELASTSVDQLMTRNLLVVEETASVVDVTNLIVLHKIRRVPVVRQGQLVGLISRRDLLRYVKRASRSMRDFIDDTQAAAQSKVVQSTTEQSPTQQAPTQPAPVQPATVEQAMLQQPPTESTK